MRDLAAPGVDVADDVAHEFLGRHDLDLHQRLEEHGLRLGRGVLESQRAGDLEGHLRRVDLVERAVVQAHPDADHREAGENPPGERFADSLVDRLDVLARDGAADDVVGELVVLRPVERPDADLGVTVLAATAGLPHEPSLALRLFADGLAVRDLRAADGRARP